MIVGGESTIIDYHAPFDQGLRKTSVFFDFYDVNMSTEGKTDSKFSRFSFGEIFLKLGGVVTTYISYKILYF